MQAVILAGGLGTRLRPLTYTTPKPLLPILNEPMVERLIKTLPSEVDRVILAVSYMVDRLTEYFGEHDVGREVVLVEEKEPLGTGGAIKNVEEHIDDTFFALNGDVVSTLDFEAQLDFHRKGKVHGTISMWEVEDPTRYGIIGTDSESKITRFLEKPKIEDAFSNWINAGVYVLEPEVLDLMNPGTVISIEREIFPPLAEQGKLMGFKFYGYWIDAGTPRAYLHAQKVLLKNLPQKNEMGMFSSVKINPPIMVGKDPDISKSAELGPFVCLGDNVKVGEDTKISNSIVLDNVNIGNNIILKDAIVGKGCTIESDAVMRDGIVIGENQVIESGTNVPSNFKIDNP
jgi:mannose-1-phosphate guanylyltransferase